MKIIHFFLITICAALIFHKSFGVFFAQDDFVLIDQFSRNSLVGDIKKAFGKPEVTHWRPLHNLYFLISGNIFGKNYYFYHFLTFLVHIFGVFLVYEIAKMITKNDTSAFATGLFYAINPLHFVALSWISGGATQIGFVFFVTSFYFYLRNRFLLSVVFFATSLLASEAMVAGSLVFLGWELVTSKKFRLNATISLIFLICLFFIFLHLVIFRAEPTVGAYKVEVGISILSTLKFYLLRIVGFVEGPGISFWKVALLVWLGIVGLLTLLNLNQKRKLYLFCVLVILAGLFPFVLIPNHISPHYMNISLFGFSMFVGIALSGLKSRIVASALIIFIVITNYFGVLSGYSSNWVVIRSRLAKAYIEKVTREDPAAGTTLIFEDNKISTSSEAYYALGTGKSIKFWFGDKNYKTCFVAFENCYKN